MRNLLYPGDKEERKILGGYTLVGPEDIQIVTDDPERA